MTLTRPRTIALLLFVLLASAAYPAVAQEITGTISGTAKDETGAALPGVTVIARNPQTNLSREAITAEDGGYVISNLPVGTYDVTFTLSGFKAFSARAVELHVNDRLTVDGTLAVGAVTEVVEVVGQTSLVQASSAVQNLMGPAQIQELPLNNRNFVQLATLVPGVNSSLPDEVGIGLTNVVSLSMAGARRNAVNWLVDGASNVDSGSNITLLSTPTLESIEEFKVITSGYNAEWPRSGGGIINVVTKSGTNVFRGSAYEFYRDDKLNANSFFRKQSSDPLIRDNPVPLDYNNFGYTLGGPALKDRVFFFWSQEWRSISRPSSASALVPDPSWLNDPSNPNYVAPADRDPNAVRLLEAWPTPNTGAGTFLHSLPNEQDTRQEVIRVDWQMNNRWRLMSRYTHDLSKTTEVGGLFFNTAVPNVATTNTDVPGQVFVTQMTTTIGNSLLNDFTVQYSSNAISSEYGDEARNARSAFGLNIPELFPENRNGLMPFIQLPGTLSAIGANQLFDNDYRNLTFTNNVSYQRGRHTYKMGALLAFEQKNEISGSGTQGSFNFRAGGGFTAFQNFLRGNRDGACGANCDYTEPEIEVDSHIRQNRYEFFVQDSWRIQSNVTLDYGLRYALYPPITDTNDILTNFAPALYQRSGAPQMNATGQVIVGTGDPLNGIVVAGQNSLHGRGIYDTDKNSLQPRVGVTWDMLSDGRTIVRGGYGIYYDQPLTGIFLQNAFVNPPFVANPLVLNPQLSNPAAGTTPTTRAVQSLIATSDPFETPRTQQWNFGVQRELYPRGVVDVGYVGSAGDNLIQPVDINFPQLQDVIAAGGVVNLARPYVGYGTINLRQTTARSRYNGLLVGFRHDQGRAGLLNVAYTLSRTKTDATNDRDAIDVPQNPLDLDAEYAVARTDRTHVLTFNYVYELPFFRDPGPMNLVLGGWQVAGITQMWSGPPISRVVNGTTNGGRRGIRVDQLSDPFENLPANVAGGVYWFNPAAFASPRDGAYGNTGRAIFRLPGVHQWDITLSKNWYAPHGLRFQFRADFINAFNTTQFDPTTIQNVCTAGADLTCTTAGRFGQLTGTRAPREIQLGFRVAWR
jgi:hypothetical protein